MPNFSRSPSSPITLVSYAMPICIVVCDLYGSRYAQCSLYAQERLRPSNFPFSQEFEEIARESCYGVRQSVTAQRRRIREQFYASKSEGAEREEQTPEWGTESTLRLESAASCVT